MLISLPKFRQQPEEACIKDISFLHAEYKMHTHLLACSSTLRRGASTLARSPSHISKNLLLLEDTKNKTIAYHKLVKAANRTGC